VRTVAEGHGLGLFARAPGDGFLFRDFRFQRGKAGSFMRAIAKRLALGTPTSAPPISPRLDELHDGSFLKNDWVRHEMSCSGRRETEQIKRRTLQTPKRFSEYPKGISSISPALTDGIRLRWVANHKLKSTLT
jgi:hypothetical protein